MTDSEAALPNPINSHGDNDKDQSPIQKFYENSNIFITGCTGFLGMLLMEKLLVSCPGISNIYVLIRSKKGKNIQTRLNELFEDVVFCRLREVNPNFRKKIIPIEGDCTLPDLGISEQDQEILAKEINVIFHCAATVKFDEVIRKAVYINVRAVYDIIRLAKKMENLKSFVHVSTAFSNCINKHIEEKTYPPAMEYGDILNMVETLPEDLLQSLTPTILKKFPNTYTFTKQIGEHVVSSEGKGLPVGIYRPSIITSIYKEPLKGWINNFYGPLGYMSGFGIGLLRVINLREIEGNTVPVDMVVNSVIAAAWDIGKTFNNRKNDETDCIPVYNFESSQGYRITWKKFTERQLHLPHKYAPSLCVWYPFLVFVESKPLYSVAVFFLHTIPGYLVDGVLVCLGKRPMLTKLYQKLNKMVDLLHYFTHNTWTFQSDNTCMLKWRMSEEDRKIFYWNHDIDLDEYFDDCATGIRKYLLKDPMSTLPAAKKRLKRLYYIHVITVTVVGFLSLWLLWNVISLIMNTIK